MSAHTRNDPSIRYFITVLVAFSRVTGSLYSTLTPKMEGTLDIVGCCPPFVPRFDTDSVELNPSRDGHLRDHRSRMVEAFHENSFPRLPLSAPPPYHTGCHLLQHSLPSHPRWSMMPELFAARIVAPSLRIRSSKNTGPRRAPSALWCALDVAEVIVLPR